MLHDGRPMKKAADQPGRPSQGLQPASPPDSLSAGKEWPLSALTLGILGHFIL